MFKLRKINRNNIAEILKLEVFDNQKSFVATNNSSIIEGKGYGKKVIELALEFINTFPRGTAKYCWLSYESNNDVARQLYESVGFVETDEKDGDEIVAILELH